MNFSKLRPKAEYLSSRERMEKRRAAGFSPSSVLIGLDKNVKTEKGYKATGIRTGVMYLTPTPELCPASKVAACAAGCLNTAGRGVYKNVKNGRAERTRMLYQQTDLFFSLLFSELESIRAKVKKGQAICVRLNGTSDIPFESIMVQYRGITANVFDHFPEVQFYDYTKMVARTLFALPKNYDITLSYSEANPSYAAKVIDFANKQEKRIAVVFGGEAPTEFLGRPVVSGDNHDFRFMDGHNVVVALKAKGRAKKDFSGFVIRA